ncbi:MAG: PhoH family protein [Planctomycetaceae bacterium]|nr:PhoH family protein [Planctomycetaceae bacterium]
MTNATIPVEDPEQVRILLGAQDQNLRRVRDAIGVRVVLRGDELILEGTDQQVERGQEIIDELRAIIAKTGQLNEPQVVRAIEHSTFDDGPSDLPIDLFDKAKKIEARTAGQKAYVDAIRKNDLVFCSGPAGCGKTYLAVAMALNALRKELVRKIVLVRPAVEAGERLGFLPGDMLAKVNPYLRPLLDALIDMLDFETVKRYMENDVIEIVPLAFMRGRTLNDTFIILDEAQNTTITQMKMFLTRMGEGSRIVVNGDETQIDLPGHVSSGIIDAIRRLRQIEGVAVVQLTGLDIVRHRLVREIVNAYDDDAGNRRTHSKPPRRK